jgi:radical SAM protein with 4Fe4S-binding SPASM domain
MYFDQRGNAYPCPRANVTPEAMIGNAFAPDFLARWETAIGRLDAAMTVADECRRCPAQIVCDYGCHAWNVAPGNFFEVNCDATKDFYAYAIERLAEAARVFVYDAWRERLSDEERMAAIERGLELSPRFVTNLAAQLSQKLDQRRERATWQPALLARRFGWRDEVIPAATIARPRVAAPLGRGREEGGL